MLNASVICLLSYLLGSVSGGLLLGALRQVDIRLSGSGNAGGTNAFRAQGFRFALGVVVIDIGKGILAAAVLSRIQLPGLEPLFSLPALQVFCGLAAVVGHCFPVWHGFRGGKGAATAIGVVCVIQPLALAPLLLAWLLVLILSGWVGLATMVGGLSLIPVFLWLDANPEQLGFAISVAVFLVFTHRSNIHKMLHGEEYRFEKARWRNWFR